MFNGLNDKLKVHTERGRRLAEVHHHLRGKSVSEIQVAMNAIGEEVNYITAVEMWKTLSRGN